MNDYLVVGHFKFVDDTKAAIIKLREMGYRNVQLYSPVPNHELEEELYRDRPRSPVRRLTLLGGVTGCLGAFLMTSWMSLDWPLRTSAKPLLSVPAFVVIAFECTILLGGLFTLLALLHFCRLPNIFRSPGYRPVFSRDIFGLTVRVPKDAADAVQAELQRSGAGEVEVQYVR